MQCQTIEGSDITDYTLLKDTFFCEFIIIPKPGIFNFRGESLRNLCLEGSLVV